MTPEEHNRRGDAPTRCSASSNVGSVGHDGSRRDVLAAPLSVLGLNIRATNALLNNGFSTVGDLLAKTERELC